MMSFIRGRRILPIGVACAVTLIAITNLRNSADRPAAMTFLQDAVSHATGSALASPARLALTNVLRDVIREGGTIVRCSDGVCMDLSDDEEVGRGRDGYYVTFPNTPDVDGKLKTYQERVRQALL
jgi:hypothetical protein